MNRKFVFVAARGVGPAIAAAAVFVGCLIGSSPAPALPISVSCGQTVVGAINVNANGTGISGGFTSSIGGPPATLAAAAAACNETQFNWYQIVTATNGNYSNRQGDKLTPPFVDPPLNGLQGDPTWADNMPWYWDMYAPPANTAGYDASYQLSNQTTSNTLKFSDFPGSGTANATVSFSTWLVSLNANGSFQSFDGGFSWVWTNSDTGGSVGQIAQLQNGPTNAQYQNIIGGFATTAAPLPPTIFLLGTALLSLGGLTRRRA